MQNDISLFDSKMSGRNHDPIRSFTPDFDKNTTLHYLFNNFSSIVRTFISSRRRCISVLSNEDD